MELKASLQCFNLGGSLVLLHLMLKLTLLNGGEEPIHQGL
jgi:hypothetical protein